MKKAIALILTLAMSLSLAACSGGGSGSGAASNPRLLPAVAAHLVRSLPVLLPGPMRIWSLWSCLWQMLPRWGRLERLSTACLRRRWRRSLAEN